MNTLPPPPARKRPGRPALTEAEKEETRLVILTATEQVFADFGYHGVSVARITEAAGLVKSRFYQHFSTAGDALGIVLENCLKDLVSIVELELSTAGGSSEGQLLAVIRGYTGWSEKWQHILQSYVVALHDPLSPLPNLRRRMIDFTVEHLFAVLEAEQRPKPSQAEIDVFISCVEYTVSRLRMSTENSPRDALEAEGILVRAAVALLGDADNWRLLLETPGMVRPARTKSEPRSGSSGSGRH